MNRYVHPEFSIRTSSENYALSRNRKSFAEAGVAQAILAETVEDIDTEAVQDTVNNNSHHLNGGLPSCVLLLARCETLFITINQMFAAGSAGSATNHDTPIRLVSTH